jgi:hypothetical protein
LNVTIGDAGLLTVRTICESGQDRAILRILRDESAYIVTVVRVQNDERKQQRGTK